MLTINKRTLELENEDNETFVEYLNKQFGLAIHKHEDNSRTIYDLTNKRFWNPDTRRSGEMK